MPESGYPTDAIGPADTLAEWIQQLHVYAPDAIVSGGTVTVVSGRTVRLGTTTAVLDGSVYINDSAKDRTSTTNDAAGTSRIDRLVIRRTWGLDNVLTYAAEIVTGVATGGTPPMPALAQDRGVPGVFELPVAYWTITNTNAVQNLRHEPPGNPPVNYTSTKTGSGIYNVPGSSTSYPNPSNLPSADFTVNPTRPGYATVIVDFDLISYSSGGWSSVAFFLNANGVLIDSTEVAIEASDQSRGKGRLVCANDITLVPGYPVKLTLDVQSSGSGFWQLIGFQWIVKQR